MSAPAMLMAMCPFSGRLSSGLLPIFRCALLLAVAAWAGIVQAQGLVPVPPLTARVMDHTRTLKADERQALEAKLAAFEAERGAQIVILMIPSTREEDIAAFSFRVADEWKIGRREVGDGILVVVAKDDRRARIEVARALEGAIPDLVAFQIINRAMAPAFREGDFAGGLNAAVDALMARIRGEELPLPEQQQAAAGAGSFQNLAVLFFMGVPIIGSMLIGMFGRKLGAVFTAGAAGGLGLLFTGSIVLAILAAVVGFILVLVLGVGGGGGRGGRGGRGGPFVGGPVIWTGGRGGGFGGGFGGGGFGSGGGGSFGGGGASGRW